jgi:hypothetical protein
VTHADTNPTTTRRSFLSAAVGAVVLPAAAVAHPNNDIKALSDEFEAAWAAMDRFFANVPSGSTDEDYDRMFRPVADLANRIADMKMTTIDGLRLKARAMQWCNEEFDFMEGKTTDERLAYGLVQDVLNLPAI